MTKSFIALLVPGREIVEHFWNVNSSVQFWHELVDEAILKRF